MILYWDPSLKKLTQYGSVKHEHPLMMRFHWMYMCIITIRVKVNT